MSFEDYDNQITQKYRLAVAIAIIKTRPINKSTEQHIEELKNKISDERMDTDELDITICSDDFDIDDDEIVRSGDDFVISEHEVQLNETQMTDNSINILQGIDCSNGDERSYLTGILKEIKDIDDGKVDKVNKSGINELSQKTYNESLKTQELTTNDTENIATDSTFCPSFDISRNIVIEELRPTNKSNNEHSTTAAVASIIPFDSQATEINNAHGFTQNCTHYSQSQDENVIIGTKYVHSKDRTRNNKVNEKNKESSEFNFNINELECVENQIYTQCAQNMDLYLNENQLLSSNNSHKDIIANDPQTFDITHEVESTEDHIYSKDVRNTDTYEKETQNLFHVNRIAYRESNVNENILHSLNTDKYATVMNKVNSGHTYSTRSENVDFNQVKELNQDIDGVTDSHKEIVPFKVIEELNKVKTFLNRRFERGFSNDGYSTDSGYKSESQTKSLHKSALHLSGTWLNQSAHCLFNYTTSCPLMVTTQEINNEISQILGQLIDKLHEEEKYPSFLEELLETVEILLRQIYEEDSSSENVVLKKDEQIQHLFLLNRSVHIQKYTIEKITRILENVYPRLTDSDSIFEMTHINEIENVSYVFHILEILLLKYTKNINVLSQNSSQLSQDDDKLLKKSSITDMWRKKWNPNYKELQIECTVEKKCILLQCSEILNKIIVGCVDGYSLLAYSALKCFNLLQS